MLKKSLNFISSFSIIIEEKKNVDEEEKKKKAIFVNNYVFFSSCMALFLEGKVGDPLSPLQIKSCVVVYWPIHKQIRFVLRE